MALVCGFISSANGTHADKNLLTNIFDDWWEKAEASVVGDLRKGLNSLVILGAWCLWRHRNNCVFNGASPSVAAAISLASEEAHLWSLAGARGLTLLTIQGEI